MTKVWDIPGGIHPPENKAQSLGQPISTLPLPEYLVLPLNQHAGQPATPCVEIGERVGKGQLLAEATGPVSAALHAPTSGTVTAIGSHAVPHPSGMTVRCITIAPDGEDQWHPSAGPGTGNRNYRAVAPTVLLEHIRQAGIAGLGGAGFPTAVKLAPSHPIDTLVINGSECEPYITADDRLMQERATDIVAGIAIIAHLLGNPTRVLVGIEDNKPAAIAALRAATAKTPADLAIAVVVIPTKYPSGGEKQLIQIVTGREVPSGKLPAALGIVCHNVGTAYAISRAICHGEPLISRITTVTGQACERNGNYEVLLGTPISHLLKHNHFDAARCSRLIMGGPMMGFTLTDDSVPVIKTTNCIIAGSAAEFPPEPPAQACIRCGLCAEACPASLLPQQLFWYAQSKNFERLEAHNLFDCIECGACAYVCPSTIPLVQYYRGAKGEIRQQHQEKIKADHARQRFEFHQQRVARAEAERTAKREARRLAAEQAQQKAAANSDVTSHSNGPAPSSANSADDLIKAAMAKAAARQASPQQQQARLERGVTSADNRLQAATAKLAEAQRGDADADQLQQLAARVDEARHKLTEARRKLAEHSAADSTPAASTATAVMAKIQASPRDKLVTSIASLHKRIDTTEKKLAESTDDALTKALASGLEKQRQKLHSVEQELAEYDRSSSAEDLTTSRSQDTDAAAAAIARAQAKADAMATLSPAEKLDLALTKLEQRISKARERLNEAETEQAEHTEALRNALAKLEQKHAATVAERAQLTPAGEQSTP